MPLAASTSRHETERAAVGVVGEHDVVTGREQRAQHRVLGGHAAREREAVRSALQRCDARLERGARRVARAPVLEAAVLADRGLRERASPG